jgi:hypothetical protein
VEVSTGSMYKLTATPEGCADVLLDDGNGLNELTVGDNAIRLRRQMTRAAAA